MILDLNSDLGEGEPLLLTRQIMRWISSANIACGGHAGNSSTITASMTMAQETGVHIGAHPGAPGAFGRQYHALTPEQFCGHIAGQIQFFCEHLPSPQLLHHIKLHGAWYHLTERSSAHRESFLHLLKKEWPDTILFCLAGGETARAAKSLGLQVWEECFLDRNYLPNGALVPRDHPEALLTAAEAILERLQMLESHRSIRAIDGAVLKTEAQTACVHSDSPEALMLLTAAAKFLKRKQA
jgi:5-oxoprolinase (ATP-hydrolysing) subunit A